MRVCGTQVQPPGSAKNIPRSTQADRNKSDWKQALHPEEIAAAVDFRWVDRG